MLRAELEVRRMIGADEQMQTAIDIIDDTMTLCKIYPSPAAIDRTPFDFPVLRR